MLGNHVGQADAPVDVNPLTPFAGGGESKFTIRLQKTIAATLLSIVLPNDLLIVPQGRSFEIWLQPIKKRLVGILNPAFEQWIAINSHDHVNLVASGQGREVNR